MAGRSVVPPCRWYGTYHFAKRVTLNRAFLSYHSIEWFRSTDLWVMSPTRFLCATMLRLLHLTIVVENLL